MFNLLNLSPLPSQKDHYSLTSWLFIKSSISMLITASSFHHRYTYILVVAGWLRGLYLEIQTVAIWESICLDFLTPQWGKFITFTVASVHITLVLIQGDTLFSLPCLQKQKRNTQLCWNHWVIGSWWAIWDTICDWCVSRSHSCKSCRYCTAHFLS